MNQRTPNPQNHPAFNCGRLLAFTLPLCLVGLGAAFMPAQSSAQDAEEASEPAVLEEIVVRARKRDENLTDIPDAVTVFTESLIEAAGIQSVNDFANLTPNLVIRDGVTYITMRGITTAQQGLPPVTHVVDGVQVAALDFVHQGLVDIERIEVLRGPQGALYGAGAMAGAINITTASPSQEVEGRIKATLGNGNDRRLQGVVSGPLADSGIWSYRLRGSWRDFDGVTENVYGDEIDPDESLQLGARLLREGDRFTADFRVGYSDFESGAIEQARVAARPLDPGSDSLERQRHASTAGGSFTPVIGIDDTVNDFDGPGLAIESDFIGFEEREFLNLSVKLDWQLEFATLTSITARDQLDQSLKGDSDWAGEDILGIAGAAASGLFPDLAGLTNVTGRAQHLEDNFEAVSQELRLTSESDTRLRWLFGGWYQEREATTVLSIPVALNGSETGPDFFGAVGAPIPRTDEKRDELWAVFGQASYDINESTELTLGLRYDHSTYDDTGYKCFDCTDQSAILWTNDDQGNQVATLEEEDDKLQPKVSVSYDWSDRLMTYLTYAQGYRPGFFSTGNPTAAESTDNYEVGFKFTGEGGRASLYGAAFFIDYSEQQVSRIIGTPPFRITTNIPSVDIQGLELEFMLRPSDQLTVSGGYGYIKAEDSDTGYDVHFVPEYTLNLSADYRASLNRLGTARVRVDYRRQGPWYLHPMETWEVDALDFLNVRASLERDNWTLTAYGTSLMDEYLPTQLSYLGNIGFVKSWAGGRHYGVEVSYRF